MINVIEKIDRLKGKASIIISSIAMVVFVYNTYIKDNPIIVFIHNQKVITEGLKAEGELDKVVFKRYHLELYHANKNDKGQIKFSYLDYKGKLYKAWVSPTTGFWVYKNGHEVKYIKELSH